MAQIEKFISREDVADSLRQVGMQKGEEKPYENADISFDQVDFAEFRPAQLYVLRKCLARQALLHEELLTGCDVDIFELNEGLRFNQGDESITMIPPVIEVDKKHGPILLDGTHRAYTARSMGRESIRAIVIGGVPEHLPITSYPNEWDDMVEYDAIPSDQSLKRKYRPGVGPHLFRDLSKLTSAGPRGAGDVI